MATPSAFSLTGQVLTLPLSLANGGTGASLSPVNSATFITSNTGVVSLSQTLPTAVQGNINQIGTTTATTQIGNTTANYNVTILNNTLFTLDGVAATAYYMGQSTTTGTIAIGGTAQTGTITLGSSSGTNTVAIGAGAGTTTVNIAGGCTGGAVNMGADFTTGTIFIGGTAQTGTITVGQSSGSHTVEIGSGTGAATVNIANHGALTVQTVNIATSNLASFVNIGATLVTTTVTGAFDVVGALDIGTVSGAVNVIGNTGGAASLSEYVGTGNYLLDGVAASTYSIGPSTTTGTYTLGGTAQTGTITLGSSSGTNIVAIGAGSGATTVNIANGATSAKAVNIATGAVANIVTIGTTTGAASTTINAGSGGLILGAEAQGINGTAGSPAYTFNTQQNLGMYWSATDSVAFSVAGIVRVTLSTIGNNTMTVRNSAGGTAISFVDGANGQVGHIDTTASATSYNTSSDYRLKTNVSPMTGGLDRILQLKPVKYTWIAQETEGEGFIAHELQQLFPLAVTGYKDQIGTEGIYKDKPKYQGVDSSFLIAAMVSAIQEMHAEIVSIKGHLKHFMDDL